VTAASNNLSSKLKDTNAQVQYILQLDSLCFTAVIIIKNNTFFRYTINLMIKVETFIMLSETCSTYTG